MVYPHGQGGFSADKGSILRDFVRTPLWTDPYNKMFYSQAVIGLVITISLTSHTKNVLLAGG